MTGPEHEEGSPFPFTPARRTRRAREEVPYSGAESSEDADLERGRTVALLATMGRMQLRLDVLAREQSEALSSVLNLLTGIEARLAALERRLEQAPDASTSR